MTALSWDVFSALQVPKVAGIKCICWLLSNKSLLLCIPLELFMYRVPWYIAMWLGSVERRRPLNHTFKIKVIWEQNHVSGDSFSFLCQWLYNVSFPERKKMGSTPGLYCDLLLSTASFGPVPSPPCVAGSPRDTEDLPVNLFGRKDKIVEEQRRERDCALTSRRTQSFMPSGAF